jgi:site-specific recombinase XerD
MSDELAQQRHLQPKDSNSANNTPHPVAVYLASLNSANSRRVMRNALRTILGILVERDAGSLSDEDILRVPWHNLRYEHVQAVRARLHEQYSASTVNRMLSALRGVLREAWRLGYMDAETLQRTIDIKNVRGETVPSGRDLASGEILSLVNACLQDKHPAMGVRDAAIIGILYVCGIRRSEVAQLRLADFNPVNGALMVQGKGNKQRYVYVTGGAFQALQDWLVWRGDEAGALFLPTRKGGKIVRRVEDDGYLRGINAQTVYDMLKKRGKQAGVENFSPHDLRRTFVGDLLDRGADLVTVQKIAGHANANTTARYDRRGERTKQEAAQRLHFPYQKKVKKQTSHQTLEDEHDGQES